MSSDITSSHDENQESGLWLWHARRRYSHRLPSPPHASNNSSIRSSLLCEEGDGAACRGGAYIARGHTALDASGHASAGGYGRRGARTSPTARRCACGHPRSSRRHSRTSGRALGHCARTGANGVRAGGPLARLRDRAPTGEKGGASHITASREKNPRIR